MLVESTPEESQAQLDAFHAYWDDLAWTEYFEIIYGAELYRWARKHNAHSIVNRDIADRLFDEIHIDQAGCWIWDGAVTGLGYGHFSHQQGWLLTHRASYMMFKGEIPEGLELDHLCRVRACCNPDHLEAVTHGENVRRGIRVGRSHCIHGHEFTPENTQRVKGGRRHCRICQKASGKRNRRRKSVGVVQTST